MSAFEMGQMKGISCNSNLLSDLPLEQAIDVLAEYGYHAVDICMEIAPPFCPVPTPHMSPQDDAVRRRGVVRHAERAGIAIAALNAHTNLCTRDPKQRQANTEFVAGSLQLAADLGVPIVVTAAGGKNAYGYEQWFLDWTVEALRRLLPLAEKLGVALALECGSPAGSLIYNIETLQKLLALEGLDSARVLFDPAHYQIRGDSPVRAYQTFRDRIVHIHAKDACGDPENTIFPPLGQGEVDFEELFAALSAAQFYGYIAVEYEAFAWDFPKDYRKVLPQEKAFLDDLIARHWNVPEAR